MRMPGSAGLEDTAAACGIMVVGLTPPGWKTGQKLVYGKHEKIGVRALAALIDLTHEIKDRLPVYPGHPPVKLERIKRLDTDGYTNHLLEISMHAGTHIDAPMHLVKSSTFMSELTPEIFVGEACILDARSQPVIGMEEKYQTQIKENSIVVLYTGWDQKYGTSEYFEGYPVVDLELARHLVEKRVKMLCVDTPAPDKYPHEVHKLLLSNNILIAENLCQVDRLLGAERVEIMAFPLKIRADGSPARIIARVL